MTLSAWGYDMSGWGKSMITVGCSVAAPLLVSCYPNPHKYTVQPEISGTLVMSGAAVYPARVLIGQYRGDGPNRCAGATDVGTTSANGRFHVNHKSEVKFLSSLINPQNLVMQSSVICFKFENKQTFGGILIARTDRMESVVLSCDLDSAPVELKQRVELSADQWGICKSN